MHHARRAREQVFVRNEIGEMHPTAATTPRNVCTFANPFWITSLCPQIRPASTSNSRGFLAVRRHPSSRSSPRPALVALQKRRQFRRRLVSRFAVNPIPRDRKFSGRSGGTRARAGETGTKFSSGDDAWLTFNPGRAVPSRAQDLGRPGLHPPAGQLADPPREPVAPAPEVGQVQRRIDGVWINPGQRYTPIHGIP